MVHQDSRQLLLVSATAMTGKAEQGHLEELGEAVLDWQVLKIGDWLSKRSLSGGP